MNPRPGFGAIVEAPPLAALRCRLHDRLMEIVHRLPAPLARDCADLLNRHGRVPGSPTGNAFVLFPPPVWSFLHWIPAARHPDAERVHAAALLLHLWDDHLLDGQLPLTLAHVQLRTELWRECTAGAERLCHTWGVDPALAAGHTAAYLTAVHAAPRVDGPVGHRAGAGREAALWALVPSLLAAPELPAVIRDFAVAWRLVDDAADVPEDAAAGARSAVWWELAPADRVHWRPGAMGGETWCEGAVRRVLAEAARLLAAAQERAATAGLQGLAAELATAAAGVAVLT
ncbi:hypothetical protein ACH4OW_26800 [Streptomyces sp. NPDC017056]|uniref:hypothetical protein n=1 Tax=Streptomyces sp. NPDC017056 TaxID=3364973 RepID=UPI0037A2F521